ncbi:unnamed protein product [Aspergillus oryzae RIB40]|uniref:DNA, SC003 n=1 Tax=Aspergillus oryzae (strain ATCC 42149 / RIB 40) TaxID=510516 RepID=Q2ULB6_ASPOR|nr:unnamed protein product [Aspergillus oryzae RIB40]BAE57649.1 unnamed protein product [Aspergillus oryzae RIB40]
MRRSPPRYSTFYFLAGGLRPILLIFPVCGRCQRKRELQRTCTYITASDHRSSTVNHHHSSAVVSPQLPTPATSAQINSGNLDAISPPSAHSPVNPGEFSFEVRAAVDARLGLPSPKKRCPIPLTDAPLFGLLSIPDSINPIANPADNVLPPRRHADHLVNLYWQCLDPLEPLLDQRSFWTTYEAIFDAKQCQQNFLLSSMASVASGGHPLASRLIGDCSMSDPYDTVSSVYFKLAPDMDGLGFRCPDCPEHRA